MKQFKTEAERAVGPRISEVFERSPDSIEDRLATFPRYVRRQQLKRFLAMYELYKMILPVKGSVVECGVFRGFGFMSWFKLSSILEPENLTRRVYGFDTFEGFPSVTSQDDYPDSATVVGGLASDSHAELLELIEIADQDRFLGHIPKAHLIRGDISITAPRFVDDNPHLLVSLLFLDADLYEPTKAALDAFVPRMPKGAILAFDELDNPQWPGETLALLDGFGLNGLELQRLEWDPYISFARIGG